VSKPAPPAKSASSAKTAPPAAKPALKATGKPVAKPAPKPAVAPAVTPAAKPTAKPGAKAAPAPAKPAHEPAAARDAGPAAKPAKQAAGKPVPSAAPAVAPAPVHPAESGNRFTDRFAPARPTIPAVTEIPSPPKPPRKIDPKLANAWKYKAGRELTEDELLAMPDGEYMNDKQLEFFRARLQQQKDDLLSNADETTEHLREDTSIVPDPADRATIEEEHALELRTRDRERKLLKKIAQSLARLESGDYGYCDETGEPIGLGRLLARPTATLSLEAQQRRELKQKMFGN